MKESQAFINAKTATLTLARSLRIGDVIEAFYADADAGRLELVIEGTESSKKGDQYDIRTIPLEFFGERAAFVRNGMKINTNKYRKVGSCQMMNPSTMQYVAS